MLQKGFAQLLVLLLVVVVLVLALFFYFSRNTAPQQTSNQPTSKVNSLDAFSMWFDKENTMLDREISPPTYLGAADNVITDGKIVGWVKANNGKMQKLEYAWIGCNQGGCGTPSAYTTVFDTVQQNNPAQFTIDLKNGMKTKRVDGDYSIDSWIVFRLTDNKGITYDPLEKVDNKYRFTMAGNKLLISIGGGDLTKTFDMFSCKEDVVSFCPKEWKSQRVIK